MAGFLNFGKHILELYRSRYQQLYLVPFIERNVHLPEISNGKLIGSLRKNGKRAPKTSQYKKDKPTFHAVQNYKIILNSQFSILNFIRIFASEIIKTYQIMSKVVINSYEDFQQYVGQVLGTSDYVELPQERINMFADATLDHQWIHVDIEKAKAESPFGQTIAHGYLTLSMLPYLWDQIIEVNNLERMMNYGMDKMKFAQPVLSGQHIRMVTKLEELANLRGAIKTTIKFTIEIQETGKKALEGLATFIYYFKA